MASPSRADLDDHRGFVGDEVVDRIRAKAEALRGQRVVHMNSTFNAGGVVEILTSLVGLQNQLGIPTEWRLLRGSPAFFAVTRRMHDALQAGDIELTAHSRDVFEETFRDNAVHNQLDHDAVYMHDHHTIGMVQHYRKRGPWLWRCHLDLSEPHRGLIDYLRRFAEQYSCGIFILDRYHQDFRLPQTSFLPAIDPTRPKSRELSADEVRACLEAYGIPLDRPLVAQISRFDRWKDPHGVVDAFARASREVDATLVLAGNRPDDDPAGNDVHDRLLERRSERVIVLDGSDPRLVSALQQHATVVLQKSLREGLGLTVAEALWKGTPVIGGNAGGIPEQIDDGVDGYLVDSVDAAAARIAELVADPDRAAEMGSRGREKVRRRFLITRLLEQHLDLLAGFEARFVPNF